MSNLKFVVICSMVTKIAFCACITVAAIHFSNPKLLWWYLLAAVSGFSYSNDYKKEN